MTPLVLRENNDTICFNTVYLLNPDHSNNSFAQEKIIDVRTDKSIKHLYFILGSIQDDNLGLHGLLVFVESFVLNNYC
ncbi:Protein of unknown function [Cotesia congregata]|uniref:Uncharacterized protein n=1 Tax=Cotesia congregata TaxID=51543 RepID=A0A8J2H8S1_COTCN|nr:Protein of unknown function [Cotesia congregata]